MAFPSELGSRAAPLALRQVLCHYLQDAKDAAGVLRGKKLSKKRGRRALHDFRVALRRMRTLLQVSTDLKVLGKDARKQLARLHGSTNEGRDLQVQLQWLTELTGDGALQANHAWAILKPERQAAKKLPVDKILGRFDRWCAAHESSLQMMQTPPMNGLLSYEAFVGASLAARIPRLRAELQAFAEAASDEALHDARLSIKRVRYLIEPLSSGPHELAPLVDDCRYLQTWLGDARDLRALGRRLILAKAKGEARRELDTFASAAASFAEEKIKLALEHGVRHRVSAEQGVFDGWVDALARAAERLGAIQANLEIERKYLLTALPPEVKEHACLTLDQGYLPGKEIRERIRRIEGPQGTTYRRTIKAGRGVQRIEFEEPMDAATFEQLWPLTEGARVSKRRYIVPAGDLVWEVDEFTDRELVLAEVELDSADIQPPIPAWLEPHLVRDVTDESGFVNQKLAC